MPQITGQTQLPGTGPLRGTWYVNIGSHNGLDVVGDGTIVRLGEQPIARDEGTGSTATLPNGVYNFTFYTEDDGAQRQHRYGPYKFELTTDAVWGDVVEAPIYSPVTPTDVTLAQAARTEAVAAAASAAASAVAAAAPADGAISTLLGNNASASGTELGKQIARQAPAKWEPTVPNIGIRSDAFFVRASADGNVETQVNAFLADANLKGKKRLVGYAKIANPVTVPAGTWLDGSEAVIEQTTTAKTTLNVTGDGVRINGLRMIGPNGTATYRTNEHAIRAVGANATSPIRGLRLEDVSIERFGFYGIQAQHVYDLEVLGCDIYGAGYAGIMMLSVIGGRVEGGTIDGAIGNGSNSYGIAMTRAEVNSLTTDPRTQDVTVHGVTVKNIPWEGIDSHAGKGITVSHCRVVGCLVGIAMVPCDDETGTRYAPFDFTVTGNRIDSDRIDGTAQAGITVAGASGAAATDPAVQYATGTVTGNVIRGHGLQTNVNLGAIYMRNTQGLTVTGNSILQPSPHGIALFYDNRGVTIAGNSVHNAWSNTVTVPAAVASRSANNTGRVGFNTLLTTSAPAGAVYKNVYGFRSDGTGGDWGTNGNMTNANFFTAAATPVSGIA